MTQTDLWPPHAHIYIPSINTQKELRTVCVRILAVLNRKLVERRANSAHCQYWQFFTGVSSKVILTAHCQNACDHLIHWAANASWYCEHHIIQDLIQTIYCIQMSHFVSFVIYYTVLKALERKWAFSFTSYTLYRTTSFVFITFFKSSSKLLSNKASSPAWVSDILDRDLIALYGKKIFLVRNVQTIYTYFLHLIWKLAYKIPNLTGIHILATVIYNWKTLSNQM